MMLLYMLLNALNFAYARVCILQPSSLSLSLSLLLVNSLHPSVMSAVLQTPPHSQRSKFCNTDKPPHECTHTRKHTHTHEWPKPCARIQMGEPRLVGVCVCLKERVFVH